MSKADVIEVEGTVLEKLPNAMFKVGAGEQACGPCTYRRENMNELYSYPSGR